MADYKKYSIPELERLRFNEEEFYKKYDNCILLQTCNRIEAYFDKSYCGGELNGLKNDFKDFKVLEGHDAIIHLLRTASGLESMIVGEDQIIGQIKKSHYNAKKLGKTTKYLDTIFLKAVHVGQMVRRKTKINKGGISIGSAAVELVEKTVGLENKNILVIGAGEIGTLVAKALIEKNVKAIVVANRTYERAERLANELKGMAVHFDKLNEALNFSDIIICATSSPHYILNKSHLENIVGKKIIVDIANPRDVDDNVRELPNVVLYTIDDLKLVSDENLKKRKNEIPIVEAIIEDEFRALSKQLKKLDVEDVIKNYDNYIECIRKKELKKALKMVDNGKEPEKVLEKFSEVFAKRIIHDFVKLAYNEDIEKNTIKNIVNILSKRNQ
ncbi:Glutamyl-tRNA reductase [Methanothermococcus okinawensis IH1]|uniref:Glutamyl-tRNA reductase n=2 Tax=Methanothermococcus okinawensis TaxID=155863 RepID=F8AN31_METOI|nr:Glutamyl-tRNA reductase [Methanothermococcus okinawensis IH1]